MKRREIGVVTLFGLFRQQRRRRLRRRRWGVEAVATATAERGHVGHTLTVALSLSLAYREAVLNGRLFSLSGCC